MHRDIKPSNIGFDIQGDVKLFDFTSACEYDPLQGKRDEHGYYYNMTQHVGTLRYMDPQVASCTMYNELCDVYSICIVFWQILELTVPYSTYSVQSHKTNVIEHGDRPTINKKWSNEVQAMFQSGFGTMSDRINMTSVCDTLFSELDTLYTAAWDNSMSKAEQCLVDLR
jgi:serine/threonine protein kinase